MYLDYFGIPNISITIHFPPNKEKAKCQWLEYQQYAAAALAHR